MNVFVESCLHQINPKPPLLCVFGRVIYPMLWENRWMRPFLIREGLAVLRGGVPHVCEVDHYEPHREKDVRDIASLERHLRACTEDCSAVLCLFFGVSPPEPFPVLCTTVPVQAFHFLSEAGAYRQVFPKIASCCQARGDSHFRVSECLFGRFLEGFFA